MKHTIDLSKYQIRTDLAIEAIDTNDSSITTEIIEDLNIITTRTYLNEHSAKKIGKKEGNYITIEFEDVTDSNNKKNVEDVFIRELQHILKLTHIKDTDTALIIGLGNNNATPDALGPKTIDNILVTRHICMLGELEDGYRCTSAIKPGVTGTTGIETSELIENVIQTTKPDFIIVIDALASQSLHHVNKTIQLSDTGIHPGSGIGNKRKEISKQTVHVPVIALGIPTVVDAVTIVNDTINYMQKYYAFHKNYSKNPMSNLTVTSSINYLKKEVNITKADKQNLLGLIGTFEEEEMKQLLTEVLTPIGYNLIVTTKEIDFMIEKLSDILSSGINKVLHSKLKSL